MVFEKLKRIIGELLCCDEEDITLESSFIDDLGMDSLDIFQLIMYIEEEFDIEIPNAEAEDIITVNNAVEKINELVDQL